MANKRIKDLATTKYKGFMALDDADGTGKFPIDSLMGSIAPIFDTAVDYHVGQSVMYEGKLYIFNVDHPAGAWDVDDVTVFDAANGLAPRSLASNAVNVMMQWGCFYANAFTSRNPTKSRAGSIILKAMVGSIIKLPTIAGISFSIDMQDDVAAPTHTSSTGWLSVSKAIIEYEYISILAKKDDGTAFTMDEVNALSRQMLVRLFVVSENPASDGTYASTKMAHTMSKSLADETLLLFPVLEIGDFDSSGNERSTREGRCRSSVIEIAEDDMYITVKAGFKFWGFVWDNSDNFVGSLFNREVKHGDVGKILKGTRYRLVVAKDPEVYVFNEVNDYSNALILLPHSSILEKIIDDKAEKCKFIFDPILEVGSVNPSTGENASHNGRCRSVNIEQASKDIYLKVSNGYRFWGFKYAADDSFIGPIWGFDVTQDSYGIIPAGTRYRLVVAKDPEVYSGANPYDYSLQLSVVTELGQRLLDDEDKINGYSHLLPNLEVGTVNPSTGENATQNGRCRSSAIEEANDDMYISVLAGYRVWAIGYDENDECIGAIFNREIYSGDYEKIPAGTRYRLVVAKDPEVYTGANSVIYSRQVLLLTEQAVKVSNISLFFGSLEPFGIYGKTAESRRTTTKRITEYKPYNIAAQSTAIDRANKKMYRLCGEADTNVYVMSMEGFPIETITNKGSTGHDNDSCVVGDSLYIVGSSSSTNYLYKWTPASGVVASVDVSAITDNPNGSHRVLDGVCSSLDGTKLYLVCHDFTVGQELNPKVDDKLSVYELVIASGVISLVAELKWDCVYIQGATFVDGLLYVNCNTMTTGTPSNYVGVTLKVIDTSDYSLVSSILFDGIFEGEGLDYFIDNGVLKLVTCFVHNGYRADLCKFIPNW